MLRPAVIQLQFGSSSSRSSRSWFCDRVGVLFVFVLGRLPSHGGENGVEEVEKSGQVGHDLKTQTGDYHFEDGGVT